MVLLVVNDQINLFRTFRNHWGHRSHMCFLCLCILTHASTMRKIELSFCRSLSWGTWPQRYSPHRKPLGHGWPGHAGCPEGHSDRNSRVPFREGTSTFPDPASFLSKSTRKFLGFTIRIPVSPAVFQGYREDLVIFQTQQQSRSLSNYRSEQEEEWKIPIKIKGLGSER